MKNIFDSRDGLIQEYETFSRSFTRIAAPDILAEVDRRCADGHYWPDPLIQINPNWQRKETVQELVQWGLFQLRVLIDAYYGRLYGLTRYILDSVVVMGSDYPSETFRVLKNSDEKAFGDTAPSAWYRLPGTPGKGAN